MPDQPSRFVPLVVPPADVPTVHRYVHVVGTAVWVHDRPADESWGTHFLGVLDGEAVWGVDVPHGVDPADGAAIDLYSYFGRAGELNWLVAGRAVQIVEWARTHRFCGRCGSPTVASPGERAMRCPSCGLLAFPRLAPAMITLVTRGSGADSEALLARGAAFNLPMYSCLAGFVEPGESLEAAVRREVHEECGIEIGTVTYLGSQPWPFPSSLMLGFSAQALTTEVHRHDGEIAEARWYTRDALLADIGTGRLHVSPSISISRRLIEHWYGEPLPHNAESW
jgi:NAD+ diphosphatase